MFSITDITSVLSGGADNRDHDLSLGGDPSVHPIVGTLHNLFNKLDDSVLDTGWTDWRCFYIFNDSLDHVFYDARLYIVSETDGGANVDLGFFVQNDQQLISFSSVPTGGVVAFSYENQTFAAEWRGTVSDVAAQIVVGINNFFGETIASSTATESSFSLTFSDAKYYPPLIVAANTMGVAITVEKIKNGSPVNATTVHISSPTTPPTGLVYSYPTESEPFLVGDLRPSDGFPVWVRRTVPVGANSVRLDGFSIKLQGYPSLPGHPHNPIPPVPPPSNALFYAMAGGVLVSGSSPAERIIQNYLYTTTGGISVSGTALVTVTNHFYTMTGGIVMGGAGELPVRCPSFCCVEDNVPWQYYNLSVNGISNQTVQDPTCQCSFLDSSSTMTFSQEDCKWHGTTDDFFSGKTQISSWTLERDRLSGDWTLSGCAGGCTSLTAVWPSGRFLCGVYDESTGVTTFNKVVNPTTPDDELNPGETNIVIVQDNCKIDTGFSITLTPDTFSGSPVTGVAYGPITGHCYCAGYNWTTTFTVANCDGTVTCNDCTFNLQRYAETLWSSLQSESEPNYVTLEYISVGNLWRVTMHRGDTNAVWEVDDNSFNCCNDPTTFTLISTSCDPETVPSTINLTPLDCVEPNPVEGIEISGCAEYTNACMPCEDIPFPPADHPEWHQVGWSGYPALTQIDPSDQSKGVYAPPGTTFPIFFNIVRDGEYSSAICSGSVDVITGGPGQTAVEGDPPVGDYTTSTEPQHFTFNCGTSFWNTGVTINNDATIGAVIVFQFTNLHGVVADPAKEFYTVIIN